MFRPVGQKGIGSNMDSWKQLYQAALLELDPAELQKRIEAAEEGIYQRVEQLKQSQASSGEEWCAINDALRRLRILANTEIPPQSSTQSVIPRPGTAS